MEVIHPRVLKRLGQSCDRRISPLMRSRCLMSRSNFRQTLPRCGCALPLFASWEFTEGSGIGEESNLLKPSVVQCRTTLDSMSKFDGVPDTRWYENLCHPISADTCDAHFQRTPERHPGSLHCKWLLTGQLLFQVRIWPEKSPSRSMTGTQNKVRITPWRGPEHTHGGDCPLNADLASPRRPHLMSPL
jgi:hypothetical protein